ncbi:MAG: sulfatase-like hydrolase/transferase, partial [Paracoccaceae bacterium]
MVKTPNLDRLAARAERFNRAYCASPLCVPSRMAFMTGQRVQDIGIWDNNTHLPSEARTLGHRLTAAGYEAVLCGRMHFNGEDKTHGFDRQIAEDPDANASIPDWGQGGGIAAATRPAGMTAAYSERMRKRPKVGSGERLDDIAEARAVEF